MQEIYLAGGCFWGAQSYLRNIKGVAETQVGFANGRTQEPTYYQVCHDGTGHAETVKVIYDEKNVPLRALLRLFFRIIDPTSLNKQGGDVGTQYRTGIYYTDEETGRIARDELRRLAEGLDRPVVVECLPLMGFWPAEEYHQDYLIKNPAGYCHVPLREIMEVKDLDPRSVL